MNTHAYAPLFCKSNYSFLEGASHPEELVEEAYKLGLSCIAITDRDGLYGIVRAFRKARELGMKLITGAEVTVHDDDEYSRVVLLVQHHEGYRNLCRLLTKGRMRSEKGKCEVTWRELAMHAEGLFLLWPGALEVGHATTLPEGLLAAYENNIFALITRHREAADHEREERLRKEAHELRIPLTCATEVLYHHPTRRPLQDVLTCIRNGVTLSTAGTHIKPNAEHALRTRDSFCELFKGESSLIQSTERIAEACTFSMSELRYRYPSERLPDGRTSSTWLRELVHEGAARRFGDDITDRITAQLAKELSLIDELDYCGYFLTMWEIVQFCKRENIFCQGRGSAANSVVCYCLGITAVDPRRIDVLFERFISRERAEPPDIDLDIEHERREEVIQHVYAKYGRSHSAMVANVIRYRTKSALRDVGKVLDLPATDLARISELKTHYDGISEAVAQAGIDGKEAIAARLISLVNEIKKFPRHLSIHPGGFLLGHEPVSDLVPIENATMENRTVIQWDKDDVETLGLFKVDLLGLGTLTHVHRCFDLLQKHRGISHTLASIPDNDAPTFDAICAADTVGVFQIESRAQMSMLPRLRPRNYYDIVIEVSLVRPGPITGGMVHPYLRRRTGVEKVEYPHALLEPVLKKTLGVPLFQEQVMRLAEVAADYTPGEADQLRRDMAAWKKEGNMEKHRTRLTEGMLAKGISEEFAERVYKQICGFADYGFPESHAASFALLSYIGAYLKCHYPAEFACSLLNSLPMGFYSAATIIEDAKRHGIEVRPVHVNESDWDCTLEPARNRNSGSDFAIRMGLRFIHQINYELAQKIIIVRNAFPFFSLDDFATRTNSPQNTLHSLAEAGAFDGITETRRNALWQALGITDALTEPIQTNTERSPLFRDLSRSEIIRWDHHSSGHSTRGHPLEPLRAALTNMNLPDARTLSRGNHSAPARYAGIVICRQRPGTAGGVTFMTLEDETGFVNVVIWKDVFARYSVIAKTQSFLGVTGKLQVQDGVVHLVANSLWAPTLPHAPINAQSRDFH